MTIRKYVALEELMGKGSLCGCEAENEETIDKQNWGEIDYRDGGWW